MTPSKRTEADFSLVAPVYRWLEFLVFGRALEKRRLAFLPNVLDAKTVLILGDGDGRFTEKFLEAHPVRCAGVLQVDMIESSRGMVRLARKRLDKLWRESAVTFQLTDIQSAVFGGPYDLIISHFFLDCFSARQLRHWMPRLLNHTTPNTQWLISEFEVPEQTPWRMLGAFLICFMYLFFRLTAGLQTSKLPDYKQLLEDHGYRAVRVEKGLRGLLTSQLWYRTNAE